MILSKLTSVFENHRKKSTPRSVLAAWSFAPGTGSISRAVIRLLGTPLRRSASTNAPGPTHGSSQTSSSPNRSDETIASARLGGV